MGGRVSQRINENIGPEGALAHSTKKAAIDFSLYFLKIEAR